MVAAAVHLASPASHHDDDDDLATQEQLLCDIAALEEVENCSSRVLQELLEQKPSFHLHHTPPPFATKSELAENQKSIALQQALYLQQAGHPHFQVQTITSHHGFMLDAQHSRPPSLYRQHPVRHEEVHPPLQRYHHHCQQPADDSPASLLNQVLDCPTMGVLRSGSSLDCFSNGMTLPALRSKPVASNRTPVSAMRKSKAASLTRAAEKSSTLSAEFSPPSIAQGKNTESPICAEAKKGISANHFLTERQRREFLNEKYQVLRSLIPDPTKADRASIVQDAIDYVNELKECADKLRSERGLAILKRRKVVNGGLDTVTDVGDAASCKGGQHFSNTSNGDQEGKGGCTLSRKTSRYGTEVDVRVLNDEATIKVIQHQPPCSLLFNAVSMLNEAELDLLHANGGKIGNHYAYMLNVKILDNRATHAGKIARQMLEHIDSSLKQTPSGLKNQVEGG